MGYIGGSSYNPYMYQAYAMQASMQVGGMPLQASMSSPQMMMSMGLSYNAPYAMGWAGYMGGMSGMAQMYSGMGMQASMSMGMNSMMFPGPQSMQMAQMGGMGAMGMVDNTIEVAGGGMGKENKYKMFAGELLAVNSLMKDGKTMKPDEMQKALQEKYGMQTEIKDIDGRKGLVNTATGHTVMVDGNGNSIMDKGDMKFDDALKTVQEKFGITAEQFEKMYDKSQGGVGATTGMNIPQGYGAMGLGQQMQNPYMQQYINQMNPYQQMGGMQGMNPYMMQGMGGMQGMNPYMMQGMQQYPQMGGMYPFSMGQMGGAVGGIWGDPLWQNSLIGVFGGAMQYAQMYNPQPQMYMNMNVQMRM